MHPALRRIANKRALRPIYRVARQRLLKRRIANYEARIVEHDYGGVTLKVALRDGLAEGWYDHDWPIQPEIELLASRGRLGPGATVLDLGAHQAVVALMIAARVAGGKVVAVEAEPHNARVASENVRLNTALPVTVEHAAVAAEAGCMWFSEGLNGSVLPGGRAGKVRVRAVTIDEMADQHGRPDVVFIDVEGYEGCALEGASQVLAAKETDFFVEIHDAATLRPHGWDSHRIARLFDDAGAEVWIAGAYDAGAEKFSRLADAEVDWDRRLFCVALF